MAEVQTVQAARRGYSVREVATQLGIGERSVWRLVSTGDLRAIRVSAGSVRVLAEDLAKFLDSRQEVAA